ncbi:hypothetical protein GH714_002636 [Hevea brasiliensis]|uniref:Uncharacterized protein n=1 Tax=Hevea brasiliensis TaxID=3981 RepID=A0A6A6N7Y8_HEVBR|nr:hypothetical protein GH714_002636 [Hevea brasiliensis]
MDKRKSCVLLAFFLVFVSWEAYVVQGINRKDPLDPAITHYEMRPKLPSGHEQAFCLARGKCQFKTLVCPDQCKVRKPVQNKKQKGCFIDCSSRCEVTCKWRRPRCDGYGSLCYDPRFVGGDGVMFYFHGEKGGNFAIVSDDNLQINAHLIGTRPQGGLVTSHGFKFGGAKYKGKTNWERRDRVHKYQLPEDDAFAHLETQFKFFNLTDLVEGVLGQTYRPDYVSPVKTGVPMPMMGGEDKYHTPSLFSPLCSVCRFQRQYSHETTKGVSEY